MSSYFAIYLLATAFIALQGRTNCQSLQTCSMIELLLNNKDHMYTCNQTHANQIASQPGNQVTGTILAKFSLNTRATCGGSTVNFKPFTELYNGLVRDSFYVSVPDQINTAIKRSGYDYKGITAYCAQSNGDCGASVPVYRLFQRGMGKGDHFYTVNENIYTSNPPPGYVGEGIECFVWQN